MRARLESHSGNIFGDLRQARYDALVIDETHHEAIRNNICFIFFGSDQWVCRKSPQLESVALVSDLLRSEECRQQG